VLPIVKILTIGIIVFLLMNMVVERLRLRYELCTNQT